MTRHLHIDLRPNLNNQLVEAEWVQREVEAHRKLELGYIGRLFRLLPYGLNRLRRFIATRSDPGRIISGDCFFLITGAMVALDLCLIVWLVQR